MDTKIKNQLNLYAFCVIIGAFASMVIWCFLKAVSLTTSFIWDWLPDAASLPFYTVLVCTVGGALIGIFRKKYGDYPEELSAVLGKIKNKKRYEYRNMPVMLIAAFLPLVIGSSVGPEAGMTGIIAGLCYWAGDNLKFARSNTDEYMEIGAAVTLSLLFRSPLFGIFAVEEENKEKEIPNLTRTSKTLIYGITIASGSAVYLLLNNLFGAGMDSFPSFPAQELTGTDYLMLIPYILCGCILSRFYHFTHHGCGHLAGKLPSVLRETMGGLCLGIAGLFVPAAMFSGEEQMDILMGTYADYLPAVLIGLAFFKILLTNICILFGLKGGHFFPVIFAGVCLGYGTACLVLPESAGHVVFAAAVVTSALLGGIMKKPLAVTMVLFLCFPVRMFVWIFLSAAIGSKAGTPLRNRKPNAGKDTENGRNPTEKQPIEIEEEKKHPEL